jgi:hypothetical protein
MLRSRLWMPVPQLLSQLLKPFQSPRTQSIGQAWELHSESSALAGQARPPKSAWVVMVNERDFWPVPQE